jgi:Domain of unknown function (DUF6089)
MTALNLQYGCSTRKTMRKIQIFLFFIILGPMAMSQRMHIGIFGGLAAYNGDLTDKIFPKKVTNGALGITLNYELKDRVMLRGGFTYAIVGGADRFSNDPELVNRNLAFETKILELSAVAEYYFFNLYNNRYSPYIFGGLAVYHYNPYAFNGTRNKIFLKPLSTEGQGIPGYPDRQPYHLTQFALPFGGGVKFAVNENLRIGLELGMRKTFNDYLDDASKSFIDPTDLLNARGQLAVDMSYRGDEVAGGNPNYPLKDAQRGSPKYKDFYYFTGIHLTYRLGSGRGGGYGGRKSRTGCPVNVY